MTLIAMIGKVQSKGNQRNGKPIVHIEPEEEFRLGACSYHRPKNGKWVADFKGIVSYYKSI